MVPNLHQTKHYEGSAAAEQFTAHTCQVFKGGGTQLRLCYKTLLQPLCYTTLKRVVMVVIALTGSF